MSVTFYIEGLEELKQQLRNLPQKLTEKSAQRVTAHALIAAQRIRDGYPIYTGNLRNHVKVKVEQDNVSVVATVSNSAKHAWMFENGTQARHTDIGANRGSMPAKHVFVPTVIQERRAMYRELAEILAAEGLEVSGDASS